MIEFDENGRPALGAPSVRHHWDGGDGTLPSWLTTYPQADIGVGATYQVRDPATQNPGMFMSTAAAASRSAIVSGPQLNLSLYKAVRFRARFDTGNEGTSVGLLHIGLCQPGSAVTSGIRFGKFRMDAIYQPTLIGCTAASTTSYLQTGFPYFQNAKKYDVSILLDCETRDVYLMMDDTVVDVWPGAGLHGAASFLELGLVQPTLRLANDAGNTAARNAFLRTFTLERWN